MANPLDAVGTAAPLLSSIPGGSPAAPVRSGRSFADALRETEHARPDPAPIPERLRELARSISSGERAVDQVISQAAAGRDFSVPELIAIQARVYRYTQELELVSKLVDKACAGVKQTLQTQV